MARLTWFLALALLLAGCETPGPGGGADGSARGFFAGIAGNPPLPRASLVGGAIVASGPPGYCVDPLSV